MRTQKDDMAFRKGASPLRALEHGLLLACAGTVLACGASAGAATITWGGASGTDTNWSSVGNWVGGVAPAGGDDVKFSELGTNAAFGVPNSLVDAAFGGGGGAYIGSLRFGQSNGLHTVFMAPGVVLNITNGGLIVGTTNDLTVARNFTNSIQGSGAGLNISYSNAVIALNQGTATSVTGTRANLDLSGLDTFTANVSRLALGSTVAPNPGSANQREAGALFLAKSNYITLNYAVPLATYQAANATNALEMSRNPGNHAGILSLLYLGQTNALYLDSLGVGRDKASAAAAGWLGFNPAFTNSSPVAYFRGVSGDSSRVTWWSVGDMNANASSAQVSVGTNDFMNGRIDAKVNVLSLGRDCSASHSATANIIGVLSFGAGVLDANTIYVGNQALGPSGSTAPCKGFLNVSGADATLVVNDNLVLGSTVQSSTAAINSAGTLMINNGATVLANKISVGAASINNVIGMSGSTLVLSNALASPARALNLLNLTNATLVLNVTGITNIAVSNLVTAGSSNVICPASVAVFSSYPAQVVLIKYSGAISNAGFNFGFGTNALPGSAPNAFLSNNVANKSIDLVLPTDPRPQFTSVAASYGGSPGDLVSFTLSTSGLLPMAYQWLKDGAIIADGDTGHSSVFAGATSSSLFITNAQDLDSGGYVLVASNAFGVATSTPPAALTISAGNIAPIVTGPFAKTAIAGNAVTLSASVSGKPVPDIQWQRNGTNIPGATSSSLTIPTVVYPDDQTTYSLIASNEVASVTNSAYLTVIVTPSISAQPVNVVVTNSQGASFSVTAGGVPAPSYQWYKNETAVLNATNAVYSLAAAAPSDIGTYFVRVVNAAGTVASSNVSLIVNSTVSATNLTPGNGTSGLCIDAPIRVTFSSPMTNGSVGKIRLFNVTNTETPVDAIDMSLPLAAQGKVIGGALFSYYPTIISGNTISIYFHSNLVYGQTYYLTLEDGVFKDTNGAYFAGITDANVWRISTKSAGPDAAATNLVVAADGTGDFCTVQGAVDFVTPANNAQRVLVNIKKGLYQEIVNMPSSKSNITFRGEDRKQSIIGYPNNINLQAPGGGSTSIRPAFICAADDCAMENLTLTNSTPKGGGQAEALRVGGARFIMLNMDLDSFQDTLLVNATSNSAYVQDCYIQGDTDFIWGSGTTYFTNCEIKAMNNGYNVQPRNGSANNGFAFVNCRLTKGSGATAGGHYLARTAGDAFPYGQVAYINCAMDTHIAGAGWNAGGMTDFSNIKCWEYQSTDLSGTALDVSSRVSWSKQIDASAAALVTDVPTWFGGWAPQLAPNILTNPAAATLAGGAALSLKVTATGVPAPAYQWIKDGNPIDGQTNATLAISAARLGDSGSYSVVVSNAAGVVQSIAAAVSVGNSAPVLGAVSDVTVNVGASVSVSDAATDPDGLAQTLAYSLPTAPSSAVISSSGLVTWRPGVAMADTTNLFTVMVADNGSPSLSATNSFNVIVNPLVKPSLAAPTLSGGVLTLTISGQTGPDYSIWASTNLVDWEFLGKLTSPTIPATWNDEGAATNAMRFYRIQVGP
jgi:pectin methylesterase-like acyl-CoA thioesterase